MNLFKYTLKKTEEAIRNGQSRDIGNNGQSRHTGNNGQSRDTGNNEQTI